MLAPGRIDLWITTPEEIDDPALLETYLSWLDEEERHRQRRFLFEHLRHHFLVSHGLVRWVLSQYADVAPQDWRFTRNAYGRPDIDGPMALRFNLSHTRNMAVCAVTCGDEVGVDVEYTRRRSDLRNIAQHFFAPSECSALADLDDSALRRRFFDLWTLKEAYIKARGMGLHLPLDGFAFDLEQHISIRFASTIEDDPERWQFALLSFDEDHQLAIALDAPADLILETRRCVPAVGSQPVEPFIRR
jgi:4'-phosphopantetheinyl transferase